MDRRCVTEAAARVKAIRNEAVNPASTFARHDPAMTDPNGTCPDPRRARPFHEPVRPPRWLPGFPDAVSVSRKGGRMRWKVDWGRLYEWYSRHGALEVYDAIGRHLGEFDPVAGRRLKFANRARRIEP